MWVLEMCSKPKLSKITTAKALQMMKNKGGMGRIFGLKWAKLQSFLGFKAEELRKV
jgi:hypothetical protein